MVWFDVIASYYRPLFQYRMNSYNRGRRGLKRGSGERRRKREKRSSGLVDGFLLYRHPVRPFFNPYHVDFDLCFAGYRA